MSRRRVSAQRTILPDPKYGDQTVAKFINTVMLDGKKSVAEKIVYGALGHVENRSKSDPLEVFNQALENVKPAIEVKSRRVGGGPLIKSRLKYASLAVVLWLCAGW